MLGQDFLSALRSRGLSVSLRPPDRIRVTPADVLSEIDRETIRAAKPELLRALRAEVPWCQIEERAAILGENEDDPEIAWCMSAAYAEQIGPPSCVAQRWVDLLSRACPVASLGHDLREFAVTVLARETWPLECIERGWSEREVLGINPRAPSVDLAAQGLIPGLMLSRFSDLRILSIDDESAVVANTETGSQLRHPRRRTSWACVPLWEALATVGTMVADQPH